MNDEHFVMPNLRNKGFLRFFGKNTEGVSQRVHGREGLLWSEVVVFDEN